MSITKEEVLNRLTDSFTKALAAMNLADEGTDTGLSAFCKMNCQQKQEFIETTLVPHASDLDSLIDIACLLKKITLSNEQSALVKRYLMAYIEIARVQWETV